MTTHRFPEPVIERVASPDGAVRGSIFQLGHLVIGDLALRGAYRLDSHAHDTLHACVVSGGGFEEHGRRGSTICEQSTVRISPAGARHDIHFAPGGARCIVIELSGDDELIALTPPRDVFVKAAELRTAIERAVSDLDRNDALAALGAECTVLRLFAQALRRSDRRRTGDTPPWLLRVRDRLGDEPAARVDLAALARECGVHRVTLARAFREHFGVSVGGYARRLRLERARAMIAGSRAPLAVVAVESGFADQSHLHHAVRRAFGMTPAQLRAALAS